MIKKLCEEIFKKDMNKHQLGVAFFTASDELAKKLSKEQWDEFVAIFVKKSMEAEECDQKWL